MKLSVVMPVYNERATLRQVIPAVLSVPLEIELLCVDDGSTDGSREILTELQQQHPRMKVLSASELRQRCCAAPGYPGSDGRFSDYSGCRSGI